MTGSRLIFVNRFFFPDHSATSQILSDLAFHLARDGMPVSVIASRGLYDDADADLPAFEIEGGVEIHRVYRPRFGRDSLAGRAVDYLAMYGSFAAAVRRLAAPGDRLIVKTDPPLLSVALAPMARMKNLVLINWLQDLYPELALRLGLRALAPAAPLMRAARNASLKAAHRNVVLGERMQRRLEAVGVAASQIEIIANWCDDRSIRPIAPRNNPLRSAWGLDDKFVIGYSGNLGRAHEYATVLDAAEVLRMEQNLVFLFIGGGHLTRALRVEVERKGLAAMFQFRPYQPANGLAQSLSVPDAHWISLLPAMEGLIVPSKFYGVAAAGRPIIAVTDPAGEIAELVRRSQCGAVVTPGDGRSLARVIREFRHDRIQLEVMGRNARALLDQSFCRTIAFERWASLLRRVEREVNETNVQSRA
ncbi:MAG: glycosyltransferase family 4 protein [Methylocystis sp.]